MPPLAAAFTLTADKPGRDPDTHHSEEVKYDDTPIELANGSLHFNGESGTRSDDGLTCAESNWYQSDFC